MAESFTTGRQSYFGTGRPWLSAKTAASLTGSFFLWQAVTIGLIGDGKVGAGKVRAEKINRVAVWIGGNGNGHKSG